VKRLVAAVAASWLGTACAGPGFDWDDLPTDTLAFVHRTPEEAEKINEWFRSRAAKAQGQIPVADAEKRGFQKTFRLEDIGQIVGLAESDDEHALGLLGHLAFVSTRQRKIEDVDFALRGARPLDWSADRTKLLFADQRHGNVFHIYEWDQENGHVAQLTSGDGIELGACYAVDGSLVFSRSLEGVSRIWIRPPRGRPRPLTDGPADLEPECSPTAPQVAYTTRSPTGALQIASFDLVEGSASVLGPGRGASFMPDGQSIVYAAKGRRGWRLRRMHADGSNKRTLGGSGKEENDPAVSPDGRYVVFVASEGRRQMLYVREIEGGGDRPVVLDGDALLPVW
jgi:Tol biopolymer transport system component